MKLIDSSGTIAKKVIQVEGIVGRKLFNRVMFKSIVGGGFEDVIGLRSMCCELCFSSHTIKLTTTFTICWIVAFEDVLVRWLKIRNVLILPAILSTTTRIALWHCLCAGKLESSWTIITSEGISSFVHCWGFAGILNPESKKRMSPACICWRIGAQIKACWSLMLASYSFKMLEFHGKHTRRTNYNSCSCNK